jgi:signal transduction histidine kinase
LLPEAAARDKGFLAQLGLKAGMAASLNVQGIPFGMVAFGQLTCEHDWDDTIVQRLKLVGEVLANALAQARADEELATSRNHARQLAGRLLTAQEDERRRLAREMHDDVSQRLAVAAIEAGNVEQQLATDPARGLLSQLRERLIALSDDVHRISRRLHPSILDDLGLTDAIRSECDRISEQEKVVVDFHSGQLPEHVPKDVALCLYRVAQETLRNAVKHSRTERIDVTLSADAEFLYLEVRDYGCGFDTIASRGQPGLGLASIEERVRLADGALAINAAPGQGTSVSVTVPLPPE